MCRRRDCPRQYSVFRTCRLHHLIHRAVALFQKAFAEDDGTIKHDFGFLEGEQVLVTAVRRNETVRCGHIGRIRRIRLILGLLSATKEKT